MGNTEKKIRDLATFENQSINIIHIKPWDRKHLFLIEKSILKSSLGIYPKNDGEKLTITSTIPNKNERFNMVKNIKKIVENYKIQIRNIRRLYNNLIKKKIKTNKLSIDLENQSIAILSKNTNTIIKNIDKILNKKKKKYYK